MTEADFTLFDTTLEEYHKTNICEQEEIDDNTIVCLHEETIDENGTSFCANCGIEREKTTFNQKEWRFYGQSDSKKTSDPNRVHFRKIDERTIYKDVETMGFSDKIVSQANELFIKVTNGQIFRGNSRRAIIFACIFQSFKVNNKAQTHEKLIKIFDLSRKIGLKGLKYVSLNSPKDSIIHTTYITPINLVEEIMDKFNASVEQKKEVANIYSQIKNKSSKINRSRPQSVSAGLIYYWICLKGMEISLKEFASKTDLSELTILKIAKEIAEIMKTPLLF